jgi:hypothetical protein
MLESQFQTILGWILEAFSEQFKNFVTLRNLWPGVVVHVCNPSNLEVEAEGLLELELQRKKNGIYV